MAASTLVGIPRLSAFSLTASGFTPIEPLLFHLSEVAVPHGVLIPIGTADGCWLAQGGVCSFEHLLVPLWVLLHPSQQPTLGSLANR